MVLEKAEKGISGSKVSASKRDVIQELRSEAGKGNFDILLVYMFDRLGRIESETPFVLEWFVQHGIQMWSTHEGQQRIESHGDKLMNYIRFWQAAGESEKTSMRTRDRIRQIVSSGHFAGGFVPYGYRAIVPFYQWRNFSLRVTPKSRAMARRSSSSMVWRIRPPPMESTLT